MYRLNKLLLSFVQFVKNPSKCQTGDLLSGLKAMAQNQEKYSDSDIRQILGEGEALKYN